MIAEETSLDHLVDDEEAPEEPLFDALAEAFTKPITTSVPEVITEDNM